MWLPICFLLSPECPMGWILVASGAALIVTSRIIPQGESKGFTGSDPWFGLPVEEFENDGIRAGLALYGTAAALGSIPFFIAAGKNKKRSKTTTGFLKLEKAPIPQQNLVSPFLYPAIGLRIVYKKIVSASPLKI